MSRPTSRAAEAVEAISTVKTVLPSTPLPLHRVCEASANTSAPRGSHSPPWDAKSHDKPECIEERCKDGLLLKRGNEKDTSPHRRLYSI